MAEDGFEGVARTLCALPPEDFVAARDAAARTARAEGDKPLATRIGALRRPTVSAWLTNLLRQESPEVLEALVGLGAELRQAQADLDGEDLRRLAAQRHQLVAALTGQVRRLARHHGRTVERTTLTEVEETLTAALADEQAGAQVLSGLLTHPLRHVGFGPVVPGADAVAPRLRLALSSKDPGKKPARRGHTSEAADRRAEHKAAAEAAAREAEAARELARRVEAADHDLQQAGTELDAAEAAEAAAGARRDEATHRVRELRERLNDAERCVAERALDVRTAGKQLSHARAALAKAERRAEDVRR